jgi:hypothetical protein
MPNLGIVNLTAIVAASVQESKSGIHGELGKVIDSNTRRKR